MLSNWDWHVAEVFALFGGERHYLSCVVDRAGVVLQVVVAKCRRYGPRQIPQKDWCVDTVSPIGLLGPGCLVHNRFNHEFHLVSRKKLKENDATAVDERALVNMA